MSHPARVCGLKQKKAVKRYNGIESHPARVCGLKHNIIAYYRDKADVTPRAGVWIETVILLLKMHLIFWSHPARVCGLKHYLSASVYS